MGERGPVPKRSEDRAGHRAKADMPDKVELPLVAPPPPKPGWCEQAAEWYASLIDSGQSRYFEPSDWAKARVLCDWLTREWGTHEGDRVPDQRALKTIFEQMDTLGTTEASRRRMHIEVERRQPAPPEDAKKVAVLDRYRKLADG